MSATDELRRLLDERGVEYETDERNAITKWSTYYGAFVFFARQREGKLLVETTVATEHSVILTPEQAIAATLGGDDKSRYHELFGTPERTAEYFAMQCFGSDGSMCHYCPFDDCDERLRNMGAYPSVHDKMLEWLRGDA